MSNPAPASPSSASPTALPLPQELTAALAAPALPEHRIIDLPIPGAWVYLPATFGDDRGSFRELFHLDRLAEHRGAPFTIAQTNLSRSRRNVLRGIHLAEVPPGQAKLVSCLSGSIRDILVDLRPGSPTFGRHLAIPLGAPTTSATTSPTPAPTTLTDAVIAIPIGVGHGFVATSDDATVLYHVDQTYDPQAEFAVDPFDPTLSVDWGITRDQAILSDKDATAPALDDVRDRLSSFRECRGWEQEMAREWTACLDEAENWEGEPEA